MNTFLETCYLMGARRIKICTYTLAGYYKAQSSDSSTRCASQEGNVYRKQRQANLGGSLLPKVSPSTKGFRPALPACKPAGLENDNMTGLFCCKLPLWVCMLRFHDALVQWLLFQNRTVETAA